MSFPHYRRAVRTVARGYGIVLAKCFLLGCLGYWPLVNRQLACLSERSRKPNVTVCHGYQNSEGLHLSGNGY